MSLLFVVPSSKKLRQKVAVWHQSTDAAAASVAEAAVGELKPAGCVCCLLKPDISVHRNPTAAGPQTAHAP